MTTGLTGALARASARRPLATIATWVVVLGAAFFFAGQLGDVVTQDDKLLVTTDSERAADLAAEFAPADDASTETEFAVVAATNAQFGDAEFAAALDALAAELASIDGVETVQVPQAADSFLVSEAGTSALVEIVVAPNADGEYGDVGEALIDAYAAVGTDDIQVLPWGNATGEVVFDGLAEDTLIRGELIGVGVAIVILIVVFGAVAAAGVPIGMAIVSILLAVGMAAIVGRAFDLSFFVLNMITMMGLALGIDYSLVAVQRFREELAKGRSTLDAVGVTGATANRAVLFSGLTVIVSLVGMLVVPSTIMISLGTGAILVALASVLAALTLLPAVLRLLGGRINAGRVPTAHPGEEPRRWAAVARGVISRPTLAALAGAAVLATLAFPALQMRLAFPGLDSLPEDNDFRQAQTVLVEDFGWGRSSTLVAIDGATGAEAQVAALAERIEQSDAFAETTVDAQGDVVFINTKTVFDSADSRADDAIRWLRDEAVPEELDGTGAVAYVGGDQADSLDFTSVIVSVVPIVLTIVLGVSFVLLLVSFRSLVIPVVAIVLNIVSAAAAFGMMVAAFQWGWGGWLGLPQVDAIAPWIPLFVFAVLFGLSMDYHVFLLSRIKEAYDATGDTRGAIVTGLSRTGSLITGAALIMVAVFGGFALGDLAEFAQMGFGLAAAIIIDATVVRTLLVPSVMTLLGRANWYLPRWLGWLPQMRIEAEAPALERDAPDASGSRDRDEELVPA